MPFSSSRSAPSNTLLRPSDLPSLARLALADGDVDGALELLLSLPAIEDRQRRHWATLGLIDAGLRAHTSLPVAPRAQLLAGLADAALSALELEPREPSLLGRAGALLAELSRHEAARALFAAASRLDAQLAGAQPQRAALGGRAALAAGAELELADLARRALAVAALAQPAEGMRLSLCMIVRDEEEMLPRCLAAVAALVDEIVVVDTGSSDATIEIARSFGARVIAHRWAGSFAEARNIAFDAAGGDWLMYLDADEVLLAEDAARLRALTGRTWREAFYLSETNYTGDIGDGTAVTHNALRIFRNRPQYRFEGRLHEQIAHRLPNYLPERIEATGIRIEHYGYLAAVSDGREKSRRNIELLRLQEAEAPPTPFLHYNLGCEYAAAGDAEAALGEFERSWELLQEREAGAGDQFTPALLRRLAGSLRAGGRPRDAYALAEEGLARFPGFTDLVLEQGLALAALDECERAIASYQRCIELGDPREYTSRVGCGTYLPRIHLAELRLARHEAGAAIELLEYCLREHPRFLGAVLPYVNALLAGGRSPDTAVAELEALLPDPPPTARFMLGTALYEAGASPAGEAQFRLVLARQPHSARARVALGEALLAQRRYDEAAAVAAAISADSPLAALAMRTELFALIVVGDRAAAAAALERGRGAEIPAAELELFSAWYELAGGGTASTAPAPEVVPLLATMLEALLRVQDFDAFEVLLGLLGRAPLDERERRDLLAEMYLRRGFAASAAKEWMTICREEPDARALMGLARVAVVRGMSDEAGVFADAALAHDPGNEDAAEMLARVEAS